MNILIVDDHPLIREALQAVLLRLESDVAVRTAANLREGLELAGSASDLDLVILDLNMPGSSGIDALKLWRNRHPDVPVVVLSSASDRATVLAAIGAGAAGFVPKSSPNDVMIGAIKLVLAGGRYLPPEALIPGASAGTAARRPTATRMLSLETLGLTARQVQVLEGIVAGKPNKIISRELDLAERTVKAHISAVFRALGVTSRTQAALAGAKLGVGRGPTRNEVPE